jgi:hypothetical protein
MVMLLLLCVERGEGGRKRKKRCVSGVDSAGPSLLLSNATPHPHTLTTAIP